MNELLKFVKELKYKFNINNEIYTTIGQCLNLHYNTINHMKPIMNFNKKNYKKLDNNERIQYLKENNLIKICYLL